MRLDVEPLRSRDNPLLVLLRKLARDPGAYRRSGWVWLEGEHLCEAAAQRGVPLQTLVLDEARLPGTLPPVLLREDAAIQRRVSLPRALWADISSLDSAPDVGALVAWEALQALADQPRPSTAGGVSTRVSAVVLDRLQDPGNVGSILRSAAALGVPQVVALRGTVALWSPKVLRAGMGAHFSLRLREGVLPHALTVEGWPLIVTSSHAAAPLHRAALPAGGAWVFGHEGQGVSDELLATADAAVRIPQPGGQESLNVAAAAAVCLYESWRRTADAAPSDSVSAETGPADA